MVAWQGGSGTMPNMKALGVKLERIMFLKTAV